MNRPKSSGTAGQPSGKRLTPQQVGVLVIVGLMGLVSLSLAAYLILTGQFSFSSETRVQPTLISTYTPLPSASANQAVFTPLTQIPVACAQQNHGVSLGTGAWVIDSRTIEALMDGRLVKIGYAGVEVTQNASLVTQVVQQANELVNGQTLVLVKDTSDQDAEGRLLRYVFVGSTFLNAELVRLGLAEVLSSSPDQACAALLIQVQQQARTQRNGIWKSTAVPTLTFVPMVTLDVQAPCDCSKKPVCSDFKTHADAQACFNACNDYSSKLDENHDGIACENLP